MKIISAKLIAIAWASIAFLVAEVAVAQHYDVLVTRLGNTLVTGGYDDSNNEAVAPWRVFEGELVPTGGAGTHYESENPGEPGFRALPQSNLDNGTIMTPAGVYSALSGTTALEFDFLPMTIGANTRNLFFWDGVGSVDFIPVASNYELSLVKTSGSLNSPAFTRTITGSDNSLVAGTSIQESLANGAVHTHLFTQLDVNDGGTADPAQGFYLYSLQLRMDGLGTSDPAFFVFGALDPSVLSPEQFEAFEEAHGLAAAWVETNLVPEPSSLTLAGLAIASLVRGARRRHAARRGRSETR